LFEGIRLTREDYPLAREILNLAQQDLQKEALLEEISKSLVRFSGCESVVIHLMESGRHLTSCSGRAPAGVRKDSDPDNPVDGGFSLDRLTLDLFCKGLLKKEIVPSGPHFTSAGSFLAGNIDDALELSWIDREGGGVNRRNRVVLDPTGPYKSVVAIPFQLGGEDSGLLLFQSITRNFFSPRIVELYESIAQFLGVSIIHQRKQLALRKRVKELSCLYGIARLVDLPGLTLQETFQKAANLLPPAWLHPHITSARIVINHESYLSDGFTAGHQRLRSDIVSNGQKIGFVEVSYNQMMPELDEGPFLQEERHLLDGIARELLLIAEKYGAAREKERLQEQLRHADRLATIGQLSAGVAHELNEPLGAILGFAQLILKESDLPETVRRDLDKIEEAALHAREIIGKLMLFARQSPPEKTWVRLDLLISEGLYLIESRCRKSGIELVREIEEDLPEIIADPGQIYQVLINLSVNAIQAMLEGGRLLIRAGRHPEGILISVQDNGTGMTEEIRKKIFTPFFTTKDVGEGTGLGLSVVEGIVSSHGGTISVESSLGVGTKFDIVIPLQANLKGSRNE